MNDIKEIVLEWYEDQRVIWGEDDPNMDDLKIFARNQGFALHQYIGLIKVAESIKKLKIN